MLIFLACFSFSLYLYAYERASYGQVISSSLFREAIHERNTNPNNVIDKVSWIERLDNLLKQNIERFGKKFITFKKGIVKCRDYIFNFLENPMTPSDNNGSEREIRKLKIKLKNSCTFRSDFGADAFLELHSIVESLNSYSYDRAHCNTTD